MSYLYLILDLSVLILPVLLSFDKRVHYVSNWKSVLLASTIIAIPFIIWDILFAHYGVWGFNADYLIGINLLGLPLEEILFFIVVPFACSFIYECAKAYISDAPLRVANIITILVVLALVASISFRNPTGWYSISAIAASLVTLVSWRFNRETKYLGLSYLISLIPFLLMNGILTGGITDEPVVWYADSHFSGIRVWTIPLEDFLYSFALIGSVIILFERIRKALR